MPEKALLEEMSGSVVFYAPVPASILASAQTVPELANRVAFGSNSFGLKDMPIGVDVYIYASQPPHDLYNPGMVTWTGKLGAIVRAVEGTRRSGKHPDKSIRPPYAESDDTPATYFWEVLGVGLLTEPIPLARFKNMGGGKAFGGRAPEWPMLALLQSP
jgi:hypothetical protein